MDASVRPPAADTPTFNRYVDTLIARFSLNSPHKRRKLDTFHTPRMTGTECQDASMSTREQISSPQVLRINILDITSGKEGATSLADDYNLTTSKAVCRITLSTQRAGRPLILIRDSQNCQIETGRPDTGSTKVAQVHLAQPFVIEQDKIVVERSFKDLTLGLADCYSLQVDLESAGDYNWQPLGRESLTLMPNHGPQHQTILSATVSDIYKSPAAGSVISLNTPDHGGIETKLRLHVDIQWTDRTVQLGLHNRSRSTYGVPQWKTTKAMLANKAVTRCDEVQGTVNSGGADSISKIVHHPPPSIPDRSRRQGAVKEYNLKVLSANAAGVKPRSPRKSRDQATPNGVVYLINGSVIPTETPWCCICHRTLGTRSALREHLRSHEAFVFHAKESPNKHGTHHIEVSRFSAASTPNESRLSTPVERLVEDMSITIGDDEDDDEQNSDNNHTKSVSIPPGLIKELPSKPLIKPAPKSASTITALPKKTNIIRTYIVPDIKQPLYDPISKARLVAGTRITPYKADDTWLLQKHRDTIMDFSDLSDAEKEYIVEWDGHMFPKRITSNAYLPRAYLAFAKNRANWLAGKQTRVHEFAKHSIFLLNIRSIDTQDFLDALDFIKREQDSRQAKLPEEAAKHEKKKGPFVNGCRLCGEPVCSAYILVCANKSCKFPVYHDECAEPTAVVPVEEYGWRCNECHLGSSTTLDIAAKRH